MAHLGNSGMWILNRGEAQWLAWRQWWLGAFERKFWPENSKRTATVSEWPPETVQAAALVADYWRGTREKVLEESKKSKIPLSGSWDKAVPVCPRPWNRWSPSECARRVQEFRENEL